MSIPGIVRSPPGTMRIFSSAEQCQRVWRRMSFSTYSAGALPARISVSSSLLASTMNQNTSVWKVLQSIPDVQTENNPGAVRNVIRLGSAISDDMKFSDQTARSICESAQGSDRCR
jgi:hypothetical protein